MKTVLMSLFLMAVFFTASAAGPIGSLGNVNTQVIGGFTFNVRDPNYIALTGYSAGGSLDYTCYADSSGTCYQVPALKTLHIYSLASNCTASNPLIAYGYSTASNGMAQGTAPTGATYFFGGQAQAGVNPQFNGIAYEYNMQDYNATIAAGNYPFSKSNNSQCYLHMYGYLE